MKQKPPPWFSVYLHRCYWKPPLEVGEDVIIPHFIYDEFKIISETRAFCVSSKTIGGFFLEENKVFDDKGYESSCSLKEILNKIFEEIKEVV